MVFYNNLKEICLLIAKNSDVINKLVFECLRNSKSSQSHNESEVIRNIHIDLINNTLISIVENTEDVKNSMKVHFERFEASARVRDMLLKYTKGLELGALLTTIKSYKRAYIEFVMSTSLNERERLNTFSFIGEFFDGLEEVCCSIWTKLTKVDKKDAEENLKFTEERYKTILELLPDPVFVYDTEKVYYTNTAGIKLLGLNSADEIVGKSNSELVDMDDRFKVLNKDNIEKLKGLESLPLIEQKFLRKSDGKLMEVEATSAIMPYKDKNVVIDISRDITERRRLEKIEEYDKLRTEFFANLSHELRTPLNLILGSLQLMELMDKNGSVLSERDKFIKYKDLMKQNCFRLLRLVNNIIDMTKVDCGYYELNLKNQNIISIVENITLSVVDYVESKSLRIIFDTDVEEKVVPCDPDVIERIILNIISNAIKFTEPGGSIIVKCTSSSEEICIEISDTGVGIPKEKQEIIFTRFSQLGSVLSKPHEGSGIGLSLVKSLIELHGGSISLKSEVGKGSTFILRLPLKDVSGEEYIQDNNVRGEENKVEKIQVEFSDIYS